jgi:hypothetical protein
MSNVTLESVAVQRITCVVNVMDVQAHVEKVKAAWRQHERAMTWEQKILAIERMRERDAQLVRARLIVNAS